MTTIDYTVTPTDPAAHRLRVELRFEATPGALQRLHLPTWITGSYVIRDFARQLLSIEAWDAADDAALSVEVINRSSWAVTSSGRGVCVRCEFHARDPSVRYPAGAALRVHLFRGDQLLVRRMTLAADAAPEWHLSIDETADAAAHARRAAWLHREYDKA